MLNRFVILDGEGPQEMFARLMTMVVKAQIWFWWIDETLSANLVYQSNYEIGGTTPSVEANEDHDMMMVMPWWWSSAWT